MNTNEARNIIEAARVALANGDPAIPVHLERVCRVAKALMETLADVRESRAFIDKQNGSHVGILLAILDEVGRVRYDDFPRDADAAKEKATQLAKQWREEMDRDDDSTSQPGRGDAVEVA